MQLTIEAQGFQELATKLMNWDTSFIHDRMKRALHRIGGIWKRTAVEYAPISPSSSMLQKFSRSMQRGGADAGTLYFAGRKGRSGTAVRLTKFYAVRMSMLLSPASATRPMPGGLMRSITVRNDDTRVECFVPANSPAGKYAFKIHEEKGSAWSERGPGTQAKGPQADHKFITRAARDKEPDFILIMRDEVTKAIGGR